MRLTGPYRPVRALSIGKAFYVKERRGVLYACKWPRKRPRVKNPTTLAQMEKFRQANWLAKYAPAQVQQAHRELVQGTQLLPRDMMVAAMYGRGFTWTLPDHRRRYPVAARRDLSDTLDILGALPGDILARGPDGWQASTPSAPGQMLTSQGPNDAPTWQTLTGGGGVWKQLQDYTMPAGIAIGAYVDAAIPANAQEVEFTVYIPPTAAGVRPAARLSGIATGNYYWSQYGVRSGGTLVGAQSSAQTSWSLIHSTMGSFAGDTWMHGRVFQKGPSGNASLHCLIAAGGIHGLTVDATWAFAGPPHIDKLSFASVASSGLPAGTRIIVRASIP